jgi:uncharacterized hydrophobic protein (TIGR00271 family)
MYKIVNLVTSTPTDTPHIQTILEHLKLTYTLDATVISHTAENLQRGEEELYLLYLNDDEIKYFFQKSLAKELNIAILPKDDAPNALRNYSITKDTHQAIEDAFNPKLLSKIDLLQCNEVITFNRIVIGDMHDINKYDFNKESLFEKVKIFFSNLNNLKYKNYTLITSKESKIQVAASGISVLEHKIVSDKSTSTEELSIHNGKLNAFILAPTSLLSYIWYLIVIFFYQNVKLSSLPKSVGYIKTSKLSISSEKPIDFLLDGSWLSAKSVELEVLEDCLNVHLGKALEEKIQNDDKSTEEKDTIKISSLPKGEVNNLLLEKSLPLFQKASDEEFKELFLVLRDSAKFSYVFLVLMVLSTLLATTGLFANSAPVVIGAMILAPLMSPIISLSMGVVRAEKALLFQSFKTLSIGIGMALLASSFYAYIMPLEQITLEMQSRIHPTFLDLMVAIFAGIAGAYANSKTEIAKSLAGVAIAVALVPPLSVTGIGIGMLNVEVIYGSLLLFTTNLIGITLSAAFTFIVLGFAPVHRAKRGLLYTSVLLAIIAIPLVSSFQTMVAKSHYIEQLSVYKTMHINNHKLQTAVVNMEIRGGNLEIELEVISKNSFVLDDYSLIKDAIEKLLKREVSLKVVPKIVIE